MTSAKNEHWRKAYIGTLPPDFLRVQGMNNQRETAAYDPTQVRPQIGYQYLSPPNPNIVGNLTITVVQAKLARNYGLTRMDPYCRLRVGHFVYETQTDVNGGKQPRWNRDIRTQLPTGVRSLSIEIYDECNFTMDELIAWGEVRIPDNVLCGETFQQWYPLSGKQGDGVEGMVELVMSFNNQSNLMHTQQLILPNVGVGGAPMPIFVAPTQPQVPQVMVQQQPQAQPVVRQMSQETLKQIHEMFPNMDQEVIKTVAEANGHNREATINSLLQMAN